MSPYTMVDNAVVLFAIFFTSIAFARSVIVRILYLALTACVKDEMAVTSHYLLFVILPLSSEFLHAQKVFTIYIYANVMCSLTTYLAMLTLTISKLLHNEFRSVKIVYMVGILCIICCNLSYPIAMVFIVQKMYVLINMTENVQMVLASTWIIFSFCIVTIIQMKTVAKYLVHNNLVGVLRPSSKYGPPDLEERLRRRNFNVALLHRQCFHQCAVLDEKHDCNHMPLMFKEKNRLASQSKISLTNIYEAGPSRKKSSVMLDSSQMHFN
ncbi:unnamed protein product, partial [Iphiclides podalirius]